MASLPPPKSKISFSTSKLLWEAVAYGIIDEPSATRFTRQWIDMICTEDGIAVFEEIPEHKIWITWRISFEP
jgi:hypothetical protein